MKTICLKCKYHKGKGDMWYDHFCTHPDVRHTKEQDPVTGKMLYASKNDLGRVVLNEEEYPYCRDINHGNCPYFKKSILGILK